MSAPTYTRHRLMTKFAWSPSISNPGQTYKMRISPLQGGAVRIENAMGTPDPLPGDKRQRASAQGV